MRLYMTIFGLEKLISLKRVVTLTCLILTSVSCGIVMQDPNTQYERFRLNAESNRMHQVLREDMQNMWVSLKKIVRLESEALPDHERSRSGILDELDNLKNYAELLSAENSIYNYKFREPYMRSFIHDVEMAKEFASEKSPDFEPSANLIYSCQFCHVNN